MRTPANVSTCRQPVRPIGRDGSARCPPGSRFSTAPPPRPGLPGSIPLATLDGMRRVAHALVIVLAGSASGLAAQEPAGLAPRLRAAALAASPAVLAPTHLPEGWRATRAEAVATGRETYRIVYHGPDGACFAIENGLTFDRITETRPPRARAVEIPGIMAPAGGLAHYVRWATGGEAGFPEPVVRSTWITTHRDAHRLVSPVATPGGCEPVDPELAADVLASLVTVTVDGRPDPRAFSAILYAPVPSPADRTIAAVEGESVEETARRVLAELGLPSRPERAAGERAIDERVDTYDDPEGGGSAVLFTRTGGGDDAVAGERLLVWIAVIEPGVIQYRVGRQVKCHAGRGHASWSPEPCL